MYDVGRSRSESGGREGTGESGLWDGDCQMQARVGCSTALTDVIMRGPPVVRSAGSSGKASNVGPERSDNKRVGSPGMEGRPTEAEGLGDETSIIKAVGDWGVTESAAGISRGYPCSAVSGLLRTRTAPECTVTPKCKCAGGVGISTRQVRNWFERRDLAENLGRRKRRFTADLGRRDGPWVGASVDASGVV